MAEIAKERLEYAVRSLEWTGNNLEQVEGLLGVDRFTYDNGVLRIDGAVVPVGDNIIAYAKTAYSAGPPVVPFVGGAFIEVVTDAVLATKYKNED